VNFLQHILPKNSFKIVPILCGNLQTTLPVYEREAYKEKTCDFLEAARGIIEQSREQTLVVAGVDFSHIGPKFGHEMPAPYEGAERGP
jgi:predicted class III extradiol MEMO1 family dioxygenase